MSELNSKEIDWLLKTLSALKASLKESKLPECMQIRNLPGRLMCSVNSGHRNYEAVGETPTDAIKSLIAVLRNELTSRIVWSNRITGEIK